MKYSYSIFFSLLMVSGCSNGTSTNTLPDSEKITSTEQDSYQKIQKYSEAGDKENYLKLFSVHDKFHRTLILSGFCFLKIAKISLNSSFFPKPIKR